jgi:2'-hydroxyisoflavone reductase
LTFAELYSATQSASGNKANLVEVSEEFILENEVQGWSDLPVWLPASYAGMHSIKLDKIIASGMKYRPLSQTVTATLDWFKEDRGLDDELKAGLKADREAELIAKWRESQTTEASS